VFLHGYISDQMFPQRSSWEDECEKKGDIRNAWIIMSLNMQEGNDVAEIELKERGDISRPAHETKTKVRK